MEYIFAPHLDDEIIGCYSIIKEVDYVIYFTKDYREGILKESWVKALNLPTYIYKDDFNFNVIKEEDTIYLPSKYDYHPFHKLVRNKYINYNCKKLFYSVEMNVPWLEEEEDKLGKLELLKKMYPNEDLFIKNDKYWIFKSIKKYDDIIFFKYQVNDFKILINQELNFKILLMLHKFDNILKIQNFLQNLFPLSEIEIDDNYNKIK